MRCEPSPVMEVKVQADADPIIHVSSIVALFPSPGRSLRPDTFVGSPRETHMIDEQLMDEHPIYVEPPLGRGVRRSDLVAEMQHDHQTREAA